ncbi:cation diffusion facilitator family transporter [Streptococcus sciuri]|uniref:Cation diffusion facilitator family transporter n=1 Tax=Streptococcus sciuri TaxID=2973939 RepID=A0ABT2F8V9_9STRE|nr:cation diffusion facilitator family transporter [Streptococcus sciuri]MCS4488638.1 cation diffusion facilitator family transporter [Streptococcus sciuri]
MEKNSSRSIFVAFIANLGFAVVELLFGTLFNSSAIVADSVHDLGDALAIGLSYYFERFSKRESDGNYTLGYLRFSLLGAMLTSVILIVGSLFVLIENVSKLLDPQPINYNGMFFLGIVAVVVNVLASRVLDGTHSEQESILSLHFLEDTLGWLAIIGVSVILRFTDWYFLDPLLSLIIAVFILYKALPKFISNLQIFLEKRPASLAIEPLKREMLTIDGLKSINQLNVWSIDGRRHIAMVHIECEKSADRDLVRDQIHHIFQAHNIIESAIECDRSSFEHHHHCIHKF